MNGLAVPVGPRTGQSCLAVGAGGLVVVGLAIWLDHELPGIPELFFLLAAGVLIFAAAVLRYVWVRLSWRTVIDTGSGMIVADRTGTKEYSDEHVRSTTCYTTRDLRHPKEISTTRVFIVWTESQAGDSSREIRMLTTMSGDAVDPLAPLIQRVQDRILARARDAFARGSLVRGEGWALDPLQLTVETGPRAQILETERMTAVREVDGRICVWVDDEVRPRIRCPARLANAWLLTSVLGEVVDRRKPLSEAIPAGLGRLLFVRRPRFLARVLFWGGGGLTVASVVSWMLVSALDAGLVWLVAAIGGIAGPFLFLTAIESSKTLYCYEQGLEVKLLRRKALRFSEIASYTEETTVDYYGNRYAGTERYVGTVVKMVFSGLPSARGKRIRFVTKYYNVDYGLEDLRERVSQPIAARMHTELVEQKATHWTPSVRFVSSGLEVAAHGLIRRRSAPELIPYDQIESYELSFEELRLFTTDSQDGQPRLTVPTSAQNFHPGWRLLQLRCPRPENE
jgi:hypothetical protein